MSQIGMPRQPAGRLAGRHIAITGGAAGIGRATAELFVAEGARVALLDRDAARVARAAEDIGAIGLPVDVTDDAAMAAGFATCRSRLGGLDGLVTAAGIMWRGSAREVGARDWRKVLEVNLTGTYLAVHGFLNNLDDDAQASIVTLGSAQGLHPNVANRTAYAASKGGVVNLTRALAAELAPQIRANCVCPGLVDTAMADGVRANTVNYAMGRMAEPLEIARVLLFLTSSEASYVTGATLAVDGGRSYH